RPRPSRSAALTALGASKARSHRDRVGQEAGARSRDRSVVARLPAALHGRFSGRRPLSARRRRVLALRWRGLGGRIRGRRGASVMRRALPVALLSWLVLGLPAPAGAAEADPGP